MDSLFSTSLLYIRDRVLYRARMLGNSLRASSGLCRACRRAIVTSFASIAIPASRPARLPSTPTKHIPRASERAYTTNRALLLQSGLHSRENDPFRNHNDLKPEAAGTENGNVESAKSNTVSQVPWYLQVEASPPIQTGPFGKQPLPDIPADGPAVLEPILQHVSVELGIDNLELLDLRKLDPPPALGAGLIMVIGTARSEKHLHVAADGFCRWLRATNQLRPVADGLLGRNELKLKLRRKARRAKLLGSVGASVDKHADDGIRTGWVCVNAGTIGLEASGAEEQLPSEGFVGFGTQREGIRLVVQMLTEEKREEVDLEGLWGGILRRREKTTTKDVEEPRRAE